MADSLYGFWKKESSLVDYNLFTYQLCCSTTIAVNNSVYHKVISY